MRRNVIVILSLALCIVVSQVQTAEASLELRNAFRSNYSLTSGTNYDASCVACHPGNDPDQLNDYGSDILGALNGPGNPTEAEAIDAVDLIDSDGDGFLNGREVLWYDTLPGDTNSFPLDPVANTVSSWGQVKALFR